jgi:uncharacterized protein YggE
MQTLIVVAETAAGRRKPNRGHLILTAGVAGGLDWPQVHRRALKAQLAVKNLSESFLEAHPDAFKTKVTSVASRSYPSRLANDEVATVYDEETYFRLTFRDFDLLSALVKQARQVEDVELSIAWSLTRAKQQRLYESLWGRAVEKARRKAAAYAAAADLEITGVKAIGDPGLLPHSSSENYSSGGDYGVALGAPAEASAGSGQIDLVPGVIELRVSVEVRFVAERRR